ncbi:MAG: SDR family oxidoreductase [Myxococcota bacterium]
MPKTERGGLYLVTGFPRFMVRNIVDEILRQDESGVIGLLVQEKHRREAISFIKKLDAVRHVRVLTGDVANMHLGLSSEEYKVLSKNVTTIFHAASIAYPGVPPAQAMRVNIEGTQNMIEFALDCPRLRRFNHFSSAFVSGDRTGVVTEAELDCSQHFNGHLYKSKFLAELEVRRAMGRLPVSVFRPSMIVGHSQTGETDRLDGFYLLVKMVIDPSFNVPLPVPMNGQAPLNAVPVDFVARAAVRISSMDGMEGRTFHLVDPVPLNVGQVLDKLAERAGRPRLMTVPVAPWLISTMARINWISRRSPAYVNAMEILGRYTIYDSRNTASALEGSGVFCPSFSSCVDRMVDFVRTRVSREVEARREAELNDPLN